MNRDRLVEIKRSVREIVPFAPAATSAPCPRLKPRRLGELGPTSAELGGGPVLAQLGGSGEGGLEQRPDIENSLAEPGRPTGWLAGARSYALPECFDLLPGLRIGSPSSSRRCSSHSAAAPETIAVAYVVPSPASA